MIVCVCNNVSEKEIRQAIELGATNMAALQADLGVATCCGSCQDCVRQVLTETLEASASAVA